MPALTSAIVAKAVIAALSLAAVGGGTAVAVAVQTAPASASAPTAAPSASATAHADADLDATASPSGTASPRPTASRTAEGPDATGPAAFGLCTAFTAGGLAHSSTAYAALVRAAQTPAGIPAYCAPILAAHGDGAGEPAPSATSERGESAQPGDRSPRSGGADEVRPGPVPLSGAVSNAH